jgi:hypothetical protein
VTTFSASDLPRLFACPGSAALPKARTTSVWAEDGTERHAEKEAAVGAGDLEFLPPAVRDLIPEDATVLAEVALAYDVATGRGRVLGVGVARRYGALAPTEIPGTIDLLAIAPGRLVVVDHKGFLNVGGAEQNEQLGFYALAAARTYSIDDVSVAVAYEVGRPSIGELDALDHDAFHERLVRLRARVADQVARVAAGHLPDVSEGPGCRYCPGAHACPAKVALVRRLVTGGEADDLELMLPLDDDTAREAYVRLGHAKNLLKRIERAIYARAADAPIPLGDGRYFGKRTTRGNEQLDGEIVHQVLVERYGVETADTAVTREATKTSLKEALRFVAGKGKLTAAEKEVLAEVRARGGSKRDDKESLVEYSLELESGESAA